MGAGGTETVGLVPAAGQALRLAPLPCSKELLPVGFLDGPDGPRPKPVCCYLLEQLREACIERAFLVLAKGKWDIPAYLGDGGALGLRLGYLVAEASPDTATTVDRARPFVEHTLVAFGFPDIVAQPRDLFARLLKRQQETGAAVVLALLPADQPRKMDMVAVDERGRVERIVVKPERTDLRLAWISAVWTPAFTAFLGRFQQQRGDDAREVHIGEVVAAAIDAGLHVDSVTFDEGTYIDVGTPDDLARAVRTYGGLDT